MLSESFMVHDGKLVRCRGEKRKYVLRREGEEIGSITAWDTARVTEVRIPVGVTQISYGAFDGGFESLKSLYISEGVKEIACSFIHCEELKDVYLPDALERLDFARFPQQATLHVYYRCGDWKRLWAHRYRPLQDLETPPTAAMVAMDHIRQRHAGKLKLHIDGEELDQYEFLNCNIPCSVLLEKGEIKKKFIFQGSQVRLVYIGPKVTFIDPMALTSADIMCSEVSLQAIHVDPENKYYFSQDGVLFDRMGMLLRFPQEKCYIDSEEYVVPEFTTTIHPEAFSGCFFLRKLIIPKSITTVDEARLRSQVVDLEEIVYV